MPAPAIRRFARLTLWGVLPALVVIARLSLHRNSRPADVAIVILSALLFAESTIIVFNVAGFTDDIYARLQQPGRSAYFRFAPVPVWRFMGLCLGVMAVVGIATAGGRLAR